MICVRRLGVPARDASVELLFALERVGDDQLHPGHVLTSYALAAYWAMSLLNLVSEPWRLHLTDKRPAFATDGWLASVVSEKPLYRRHLETTLCPRGSVCRIPRFVVGCGSLDWNQYRDKPHVFRAGAPRLRETRAAAAGFTGRRRRAAAGKALLIQRLHSRVIPDAKALATSVGADLVILDHMPLKEQLDLFDSTRVIIAVDGGALDLSLLARPATGFVTIKRPHDSESPDGCLNCPTGGPDGPCCDWHLALFGAANGTWLGAEFEPGAGLSVDPIALKGAISRVRARLEGARVQGPGRQSRRSLRPPHGHRRPYASGTPPRHRRDAGQRAAANRPTVYFALLPLLNVPQGVRPDRVVPHSFLDRMQPRIVELDAVDGRHPQNSSRSRIIN